MRKQLLITGTFLALALALPALGQGRGGGVGGGVGAGAAIGAGGNHVQAGGSSGVNGNFGGQSGGHINAQGSVNTNGPNSTDRDFGADRARDRQELRRNSSSTNANTNARGDADLGKLNASKASETARAHAAAGSNVGHIATYETRMKSALAISDPQRRAAAITSARQELAASDNKRLTASAVTKLDSNLGIRGASPNLGTN